MWKCSSAFLFLIFSFQLSAQDANESFGLSLRGGIIASQVAGDGFGGFDKIGFFLGPGIERKFNDKSAFEVDLLFSHKGSRKNSSPDKGDFLSYQLNLSFIELPLLYKFYQRNFIYGIGIGPAFLINTKEIDTDGIELDSRNQFNDINAEFYLCMDYTLGKNSLLSFRFSNSVTPIRNTIATGRNQLNFWRRIFSNGQYNTVIEFGYTHLIGQ